MTRPEQYKLFNKMVCAVLNYCSIKNIPVRLGEAHRPYFVAQKYSQENKGILRSKHRWSLALDLWITDDTGKKILWQDPRYFHIGQFWKEIGGIWGGDFKRIDEYHFEFQEKPA